MVSPYGKLSIYDGKNYIDTSHITTKYKKNKYLGNLKFSQTEKEENQISIKQKKFFRSKNIWCASSTHNSEEILIGTAHKKLKKKFYYFLINLHKMTVWVNILLHIFICI